MGVLKGGNLQSDGDGPRRSLLSGVRMESRGDLTGSAGRSSIRPGEGIESPSWLATVHYEKDNICLGECAFQGWVGSAYVAASHSGWSLACHQLEGN